MSADALPVVDLVRHPSPHPFVRRALVARASGALSNGQVVTLRTPEGVILGDGFWNGRSEIAVRRLTSGDVRFDAAALRAALERALLLRASLPGLDEATNARRLVHAEADSLSGLIVDQLADVLVVELHSAGWLPLADEVVSFLAERVGARHSKVSLSERVANFEGVLPLERGSPGCPATTEVREHGARYSVDLRSGHKTGFFCDQRDNRRRLAAFARGRTVLDVCTYTGGFAVAALRAGAAEVTGVDLDEVALATARTNVNLNQLRLPLVHADAFDWLRQAAKNERRFDVVVLDPPKFIPQRSEMETGRGKYHDLNRLAFQVVAPGGLLLSCSCSGLLARDEFVALVTTAARKAGRQAVLLGVSGAAPDHPVSLECPETEYLKALWLRVW